MVLLGDFLQNVPDDEVEGLAFLLYLLLRGVDGTREEGQDELEESLPVVLHGEGHRENVLLQSGVEEDQEIHDQHSVSPTHFETAGDQRVELGMEVLEILEEAFVEVLQDVDYDHESLCVLVFHALCLQM